MVGADEGAGGDELLDEGVARFRWIGHRGEFEFIKKRHVGWIPVVAFESVLIGPIRVSSVLSRSLRAPRSF